MGDTGTDGRIADDGRASVQPEGAAGTPGAHIRRAAHTHPRVAVALFIVVLMVVGFGGVQGFRAITLANAQAAYDDALTASLSAQNSAVAHVAAAEAVLTAAEKVLTDSEGKVLSKEPRAKLAAALDLADSQLGAAHEELVAAERGLAAPTTDNAFFSPGDGLRRGSVTLATLSFADATELTIITDALAGPVRAVTAAMALWQAEHDRLQVEQERLQAEQDIIASGRYTNNTHAIGWYPELDECVGSVDVTAQYGVPTIAEHWSCGGRNFPDDAGTIITLTGVHAGSYRVEGIAKMLNANRDSTEDLPQGFDLLYQTCQNGQSSTMSFTGLTRIEE
jgi:hypothetical protein